MKNYTLTKTAKGAQGFTYTVTDEAGNVISTRTSKRNYVACTKDGGFYFGRLDLIGKGDHGRYLKDCHSRLTFTEAQFRAAYGENTTLTLEKMKDYTALNIAGLEAIAYLKEEAPAKEEKAEAPAPASAPAKKEAAPAPAQEEKAAAPASDIVQLERASDIVELERAEAPKSKKAARREAILQELNARYEGKTIGSLLRNFARLQNWLMKEWLRNGTEKVAGLETMRAYLKKYDKNEYAKICFAMLRNAKNKESIFDHAARFPKNLGVDFLYNEITRYREKQATAQRRALAGLAA